MPVMSSHRATLTASLSVSNRLPRPHAMPANADAQKQYRRQRALASGADADARRLRDATLHREQQRRYRARFVASSRTHALDELTPAESLTVRS